MIVYTEIEGDWNYIVKHIPRYHENKQTNKQTNTQASKQANKQTSKQTNKQTNTQASKQTNKQTNKYYHVCHLFEYLYILSYLEDFQTPKQLLHWCPNTVGYW